MGRDRHRPAGEEARMTAAGKREPAHGRPAHSRPDPSPPPERHPGPAWPALSFEDRMATVEFRTGARPHITVDSQVCRSCTTKDCVTVCPAGLFTPVSGGGIL